MFKRLISIIFFLLVILLPARLVLAAGGDMENGGGAQGDINNIGSAGTQLTNPLGEDIDTPQALIGRVINSILGVVGSLALLMFVYGGLTWMTSSGNSEKVKKGRDILIWSAIGLVIIFASYGLVRVLILEVKG